MTIKKLFEILDKLDPNRQISGSDNSPIISSIEYMLFVVTKGEPKKCRIDLGDLSSAEQAQKALKYGSEIKEEDKKKILVGIQESVATRVKKRQDGEGEGDEAGESIDQKKKGIMIVFCVVLIIGAILAFVFTLIGVCCETDSDWAEPLGEFIGSLDLALGLIALIYEKVDDLKKRTNAFYNSAFEEMPENLKRPYDDKWEKEFAKALEKKDLTRTPSIVYESYNKDSIVDSFKDINIITGGDQNNDQTVV